MEQPRQDSARCWNLPPAAWIRRLHASGARVWAHVGTVALAREAVARGADAVIAQDSEPDEHVPSGGAMASILPAMIEAVGPVPVLAASGIADGRGLAAALALGAEAVWVGRDYSLPKLAAVPSTPDATGDREGMGLAAGEHAGRVKAVHPAVEIVREMMREAERVIREQLCGLARARPPRRGTGPSASRA